MAHMYYKNIASGYLEQTYKKVSILLTHVLERFFILLKIQFEFFAKNLASHDFVCPKIEFIYKDY